MKVKEILELDCRIKENEEILQSTLFKIPAIAKKCSRQEMVPLSALEKVLSVMSRKYWIEVSKIVPLYIPYNGGDIYKAVITSYIKELGVVYGYNFYEVIAKAAICMYAQVKNKVVLERRM